MGAQHTVSQEAFPPAYVRATLHQLDAWGVMVTNRERVVGYLEQHLDVIAALLQAAEETRKRFPEAPLVLTVCDDMEFEHCYLTLYIRLREYDSELMQRLDEIDSQYIPLLEGANGWFLLTTDRSKAMLRL
ncbi:MAG: hypothetical protein KatS3mg023_2631 [Armatimonadota bacterium]|nr:MAG: hypothetical protein KatS3mg023_2631 [Armatimonadota bacterium]